MDRYLPIVNVLNAILSLDDESQVIFIRNDPMFVESIHSKRKPDVVKVELEIWQEVAGY